MHLRLTHTPIVSYNSVVPGKVLFLEPVAPGPPGPPWIKSQWTRQKLGTVCECLDDNDSSSHVFISTQTERLLLNIVDFTGGVKLEGRCSSTVIPPGNRNCFFSVGGPVPVFYSFVRQEDGQVPILDRGTWCKIKSRRNDKEAHRGSLSVFYNLI